MSHFRIVSFFPASILVLAMGIALAAPPPGRDSKSANAGAEDSLTDDDKPAKSNKIEKTDAEWMKLLSREQFRVARKGGVERPFSGPYWKYKKDGVYRCICCQEPLFDSKSKVDAKNGYACFSRPIDADAMTIMADKTSLQCVRCDARLGKTSGDPGQPGVGGGAQYVVNSHSIKFVPRDEFDKEAKGKGIK
jgi:peptide-methionine (R)-S-oxide reductase